MNKTIILTNITFIYSFLRGSSFYPPQCCDILSADKCKFFPVTIIFFEKKCEKG